MSHLCITDRGKVIGGLPDVVTIMEGKVRTDSRAQRHRVRTIWSFGSAMQSPLLGPSMGSLGRGLHVAQPQEDGELPTHRDACLRQLLVTLMLSKDERVYSSEPTNSSVRSTGTRCLTQASQSRCVAAVGSRPPCPPPSWALHGSNCTESGQATPVPTQRTGL